MGGDTIPPRETVDEMNYQAKLRELLNRAYPRLFKAYRLEFRNCFGAVAAYVNGNIFMSCGRFGVALKLPQSVLPDLLSEAGVTHLRYFPNGHVKKEYAVMPTHILDDRVRLRKLLSTSVKYALCSPTDDNGRTFKKTEPSPAKKRGPRKRLSGD
jgi:hypothetical protein